LSPFQRAVVQRPETYMIETFDAPLRERRDA
jgi:hypothetical protein